MELSETTIDIKQALQIARAFNLAFNNAFMYGGSHQTTKDSAATCFQVLKPMLETTSIITVTVERGSVFIENHCVDKLVSIQRINSRFTKTGAQSVSFDREASQESVQALFHLMGSLSEFTRVEAMLEYLKKESIKGVRINYVVYQKVTLDEAVVDKDVLLETQQILDNHQALDTGSHVQADQNRILRELSEFMSLQNSAHVDSVPQTGTAADHSEFSQADYKKFISTQLKSISHQFTSTAEAEDGTRLTTVEMLESIYKLKENVFEHIRLQSETGKLVAAEELVISEINQFSYQVIVRLIKEEYRGDQKISIKRLAQIIRRMLPDIKELKYLLPQLKDGLFAEGMSPSDYLSLVKELSKELDSDVLMQVMVEASDQIGLTLKELIDGIREAPEEAARLIVLAAEIKKGGVKADDHQMSAVLSDYIEKVSRALVLQSPEAAAPGGGVMLKAAVTRIEREILDRLKSQHVDINTVSEVAQKLADQFTETVSVLQGDWIRSSLKNTGDPSEETVLSILEQVAEHGQGGVGVTEEIRAILISNGFSGEAIDTIVNKARQRAEAAISHSIEIPHGVYKISSTIIFLNREIYSNIQYNTPFSTLLISYDKVFDLRAVTEIEITPDIHIQLTNQFLKLLKALPKRRLDVLGIFPQRNVRIPFLILPMTEYTGALYLKKRIARAIQQHEFLVNNRTAYIEPKITVSGYNKRLTPDKAAYLKAIYQLHCQPKLK